MRILIYHWYKQKSSSRSSDQKYVGYDKNMNGTMLLVVKINADKRDDDRGVSNQRRACHVRLFQYFSSGNTE